MFDEYEDSSNEESVKQKRKQVKNERDNEIEDIRYLLQLPQGKRFFTRFLRDGKLLDISMSGNSWTFFNEGHRNFAKIIYTDICKADKTTAAQLIVEAMEGDKNE